MGMMLPNDLVWVMEKLGFEWPDIDEDELRLELSGNLCRCTGYVGIVRSVLRAARTLNEAAVGVQS